MRTIHKRMARWVGIGVCVLMAILWSGHRLARAAEGGAESEGSAQPFVIEYYYKAKWGHPDEFLALFKKNHNPLLKKVMEMGRILKVSMISPRSHTTEDGRWDYRVTIVFKDAATANDNFDSGPLIKQLYPEESVTLPPRLFFASKAAAWAPLLRGCESSNQTAERRFSRSGAKHVQTRHPLELYLTTEVRT